jgi:hypothetical protein
MGNGQWAGMLVVIAGVGAEGGGGYSQKTTAKKVCASADSVTGVFILYRA